MKNDLKDQKFGKLTVIEQVGRYVDRTILWRCLCDCGNETKVSSTYLRNGRIKSCGCLKVEIPKLLNTTHGLSHHPLYKTWKGMLKRCYNEDDTAYKDYGQRGIKVHDRYKDPENGLLNLIEDMGLPPSKEHTLDRIDNNKDYEPGNLKYSTRVEQNRNKRDNKLITYKGETKCAIEMALKYNVKYDLLIRRLNKGWTVEEAIETPKGKYTKKEYNNV